MEQVNIKLKTLVRIAGNSSAININIEKIALRLICTSFLALSILYILLLGNMVKDIVARRLLEVSARSLSSEVGDMELTYLSMSNSIDLNLAYSMGFKEAKPSFATRKSLGLRPELKTSAKSSQNDI